jgi:hypothetical protein
VISRWAGSGLSVRGFCRREGLAESNFYAWRRTIVQRDAEPKRLKLSNGQAKHAAGRNGGPKRAAQQNRPARRVAAPKRRGKGPKKAPTFVPVVVTTESQREAGFVIELAGGRRLLLPEAITAERLAAVVHALEGDRAVAATSDDRPVAAGARR